MKFSVCIDAVFRGRDIFESLVQIKKLGIDTFEFWRWWGIDLTSLLIIKGITCTAPMKLLRYKMR